MQVNNIDLSMYTATEVGYLGSFIRGPYKRSHDFYAQRTTVFENKDFTDQFSAGLARAIAIIYTNNEHPTPEKIAETLLTAGIIQSDNGNVSGEMETWNYLGEVLEYYAVRGAENIKDFRKRERLMKEAWRTKKLSPEALQKKIDEISRKHTGASIEKAIALREYLDELVDGTDQVVKMTDWDDQNQMLADLPAKFSSMVGKPRFTFPTVWNVNNFIPVLRPGEKCVLSGGTGDGKSALAMQFAEWACSCGKKVLVIHMEDSDETILMRQTVRWIGGTLNELERGDPLHRMDQMLELRKQWQRDGGKLIYKYLAGLSIPLIIEQIKETANVLESNDEQLDVVVMDYFQKANHDDGKGNYVVAANKGAEDLKIIAERLKLFMFVVSQETPGENGTKHTAWSRALEQKPQIYISLTRQEIKKIEDEEMVTVADPYRGTSERKIVAGVGERSAWTMFQIKKVNQGRQGIRWLFFDGPRFRAFDPEFMRKVEAGQASEFVVPILPPPDDTFLRQQQDYLDKFELAWHQLEDPDTRKRNKMKEANSG